MKLLVCLSVVACLAAASIEAQVITNFNFSGDTPGSSPSGWTSVSPASPTLGTLGAVVTNVAGNNQLNMLDYSGTASASVQQDFSPVNDSLHLSLTFSRNANIAPSTTTQALYVSLGANGQSQGSTSNRAVALRLFNDGTIRIDSGFQSGSGNLVSNKVVNAGSFETAGPTFGSHSLDIFAYSGTAGGATFGYTGPDSVARVLDPHSYAVYIDNVLVTLGTTTLNGNYGFQTNAWGVYTGTDLGRFSLLTGGAGAISGIDFLVDNVQLSVIPEPSTFALLGAGGLLLIWMRRNRSVRLR
jgi:hypothetical protein